MVAHGASRGLSGEEASSPEGDTSMNLRILSSFAVSPSGLIGICCRFPTACAVGYHLTPSGL